MSGILPTYVKSFILPFTYTHDIIIPVDVMITNMPTSRTSHLPSIYKGRYTKGDLSIYNKSPAAVQTRGLVAGTCSNLDCVPGTKFLVRTHGGNCCSGSPIRFLIGLFSYFVTWTCPTNSTRGVEKHCGDKSRGFVPSIDPPTVFQLLILSSYTCSKNLSTLLERAP